LTNRLSTLILN